MGKANQLPEVLSGDDAGIVRAASILRDGGIVALPTETVYGLAGRADRDGSVAAIYRAKGRPSFNPLIVHVPDLENAERLAVFDERARDLAALFWPGPLTMVLPLRDEAPIAKAVTAGLSTIALRMPAHPLMRGVLEATGLPLAAPSANRSGGVSPTETAHVVASLGGRIDAVLDGGMCKEGLESTIVALRSNGGWQMLRPGPIAIEALEGVLGPQSAFGGPGGIEAPGQLESHYAPGKPLRLNAQGAEPDEFLIGFGSVGGAITLSESGDLGEAAARLYAALHQAAEACLPKIAVAPIPAKGIGLAINDRLKRAAA